MKAIVALTFLALIAVAQCGGLDDFFASLNKGIDKFNDNVQRVDNVVSQVTTAVDATVGTANGIVETINKDVKSVQKDIQSFTDELQHSFTALADDADRIIRGAKKFIGTAITDAKTIAAQMQSQLTSIIESAEKDMKRAVDSAKAIFTNVQNGVKVTYKDGKLLVEQNNQLVDLQQIIKDAKDQNKESLQKVITELNAALASGQKIVEQARALLTAAAKDAQDTSLSAKQSLGKIQLDIQTFVANAKIALEEFKAKANDKVNEIVNQVNQLSTSVQTILQKANDAAGNIQNVVKGTTNSVNTGSKDISNTWKNIDWSGKNKKATSQTAATAASTQLQTAIQTAQQTAQQTAAQTQDTAAKIKTQSAELQVKLDKTIQTAKTQIAQSQDSVKKAETAVAAAEKTMSDTLKGIKEQIKAAKSGVTGKLYTVNVAQLNVRTGPSTATKAIRMLKLKEEVTVLSESNGWGCIGSNQYVSMKYLTPSKSQSSTSQISAVLANAQSSFKKALSGITELFNTK